MSDFEARLTAVELRNKRVEFDKAWEISWARRGLIAIITYVCAIFLLNVLGQNGSWKYAFVPAMGYLLSTLSLPVAKILWLKFLHKNEV